MKHIKLFEQFVQEKINEGKSKIPTVEEMKKLFDQANIDAKENGELVVSYDHEDAIGFYEDQINNIYFGDGDEPEEEKDRISKELAVKLCEYGSKHIDEKVNMEKLEFELKQAKKDNPDKDVSYFFIKDGGNGYKIQIKDRKEKKDKPKSSDNETH